MSKPHFNGLKPAEAERLALLLEECGEAIQAIGKVLRHGYESHHPSGGPTNRELLQAELGDITAAIRLMTRADDVASTEIEGWAEAKRERVREYLHHQPKRVQ